MGLRMAYWFGFAAVAGAFGGLIAFGVQHAHASIENWKLLFVVEVSNFFALMNKSIKVLTPPSLFSYPKRVYPPCL